MAAGMHTEVLPPQAQQLLATISDPRQDLLLGYWEDILTTSPTDMADRITAGLSWFAVQGAFVLADHPVEPALRVNADRVHGNRPQWMVAVERSTLLDRTRNCSRVRDPLVWSSIWMSIGWLRWRWRPARAGLRIRTVTPCPRPRARTADGLRTPAFGDLRPLGREPCN